jgi:hypothetical protein
MALKDDSELRTIAITIMKKGASIHILNKSGYQQVGLVNHSNDNNHLMEWGYHKDQ